MIITTEKTRRYGGRRTGPHRGESTIGSGFSSNAAAAAAALATIYTITYHLKWRRWWKSLLGAQPTSQPAEQANRKKVKTCISRTLWSCLVCGSRHPFKSRPRQRRSGKQATYLVHAFPRYFMEITRQAETSPDLRGPLSSPVSSAAPSRAAVVIAINKLDAIFIAELKSLSCAFRGSQVHQSPGKERWWRWWWFCGTRTAFFRPSHESHVDGQNYQHIPTLLADNHQDSFRP